jgi:hypothetical protein
MEILTPSARFWRLLKPDSKDIRNVYIYSIFNGLVNLVFNTLYDRYQRKTNFSSYLLSNSAVFLSVGKVIISELS